MFIKMNAEPLAIEEVADEHDEAKDFLPSFWFGNRRYYLDDFVRVHCNPWIHDSFPAFIHGMQADEFFIGLCLYLELIGDSFVNVYVEREE